MILNLWKVYEDIVLMGRVAIKVKSRRGEEIFLMKTQIEHKNRMSDISNKDFVWYQYMKYGRDAKLVRP